VGATERRSLPLVAACIDVLVFWPLRAREWWRARLPARVVCVCYIGCANNERRRVEEARGAPPALTLGKRRRAHLKVPSVPGNLLLTRWLAAQPPAAAARAASWHATRHARARAVQRCCRHAMAAPPRRAAAPARAGAKPPAVLSVCRAAALALALLLALVRAAPRPAAARNACTRVRSQRR
jgi:hypothetical protein